MLDAAVRIFGEPIVHQSEVEGGQIEAWEDGGHPALARLAAQHASANDYFTKRNRLALLGRPQLRRRTGDAAIIDRARGFQTRIGGAQQHSDMLSR